MSGNENSSDAGSSGPRRDADQFRAVWEVGDRPSVSLIEAVADATDREPTDVPLLQDRIDVDALDALLEGADDEGGTVRVSFTYDGADVTVGSDGEITVGPQTGSPSD